MNDTSTLPDMLAAHVRMVESGLRPGASGPDRIRAIESFASIITALVGARGRAEAAMSALYTRKDL